MSTKTKNRRTSRNMSRTSRKSRTLAGGGGGSKNVQNE